MIHRQLHQPGRWVALAVAAAATLLAAPTAVGASSAQVESSPPAPSSTPTESSAQAPVYSIVDVRCGLDHRASDDPIVKPDDPGASHSHDFLGNRTTNAASTGASLLEAGEGATSCAVGEDTSAYWFPTPLLDGKTIDTDNATVYYFNVLKNQRIVPPPAGLKMVAGAILPTAPMEPDVMMTGTPVTKPGGGLAAGYTCAGDESGNFAAAVPRCGGEDVTMRILFPDCWDGVNLDSADHRSHLGYSTFSLLPFGSGCPSTHPVAIPQVQINVPLPGVHGPDGFALASGDASTLHADTFFAWQPAAATRLAADLNKGTLTVASLFGERYSDS